MENRRILRLIAATAAGLFTYAPVLAQEVPALVVHEWGTLTTRHGGNGIQAGGMNVIDPSEAVPDFVHTIEDDVLRALDKGGRPTDANASVTMRLETPVLYFYPSRSFDLTQTIDVRAEFRGGLLNEFYPDAQTTYEGIRFRQLKGADRADWSELTERSVGTLQWWGLTLGGSWPGPETVAPQWIAPRRVRASDVRARNGESERYLFYRGVARLPSLLQTRHNAETKQVTLLNPENAIEHSLTVPNVWLVQVGSNGGLAFDELGSLTITRAATAKLAEVSADFPEHVATAGNVGRFRASLREALTRNGLYADEAEAMLNTWEHAYFQAQGTRIVFIVPRAWVDHHLPLKISISAELTRVYIGQIELSGI